MAHIEANPLIVNFGIVKHCDVLIIRRRGHPKSVIGGTFDWVYEHLGLFSWCIEIWSPMREAGLTNYKFIDWFRDHPPADDLKLYQWNKEKLGGAAHVDWKPFRHPQLGEIERQHVTLIAQQHDRARRRTPGQVSLRE